MNNQISKKQIVAEFEKYGSDLTVMAFDLIAPKKGQRQRVITYGGLNIHKALAEIIEQIQAGHVVKVYYALEGVSTIPDNYAEVQTPEYEGQEAKFDFWFGSKKRHTKKD